LADRGLDALVVSHPANVRYLTGFTGSSAVVVVAHSAVSLLTDSRYDAQAEAEVAGIARVEIVSGDLWGVGPGAGAGAGAGAVEKAVDAAPDLRRVGFEAHDVSARAAAALGGHSAPVEFVPTSEVVEAFRAAKDAGEVAAIGGAARVASEALDAILPIIRPGLRELDVAAALERELRVRGSEWHPFPTIAASGPRSAMPHAGTTERTIEAGDWLLLDLILTDEIGIERNVVVSLHVHEMVQLAVVVGILHRPPFQTHLVDPLAGVPGSIRHCSGEHVLQLATHERSALAGLHMLKIGDLEQLPVNLEHHSVAKIRSASHCD